MKNFCGKWEITPAFTEKLVGESISDLSVKKGSNIGDNVFSRIHSITAKTGKGKTVNLVFKTFPEDPKVVEDVITCQAFRVETAIYDGVVQSLEKLLQKAGQSTSLPLPKFYAAYNDDVKDYLCLEDLRPAGYEMLDKYRGLGFRETSKVLQELARFHALTYHLLRYEGEKYFEDEKVRVLGSNFWTKDTIDWEDTAETFGGATTIGIDFIAAEDSKLAQKVKFAFGDIQNAAKIVKATTMKTDDVYFPCILHGDLWTNNILFKYTNENIESIKFIDFQQSRRGNIFEDLQYFLLTSTTPTDRKAYLSQWLETYYSSFKETLRSLNCPIPLNFTQGFFVDEMWKCFLSGYSYMFFAIPFQLGIPTSAQVHEDNSKEEHSGENEMISGPNETPGTLHEKLRKWMSESPVARRRLMDITKEFVENSLL